MPRNAKDHMNAAGNLRLLKVLFVCLGNICRSPTASGVFLVNPPHTLKPALQQELPALVEVLGRGRGQGFAVEAGG